MTSTVLARRRRIAQGREAEIFEWDDGFVLKLYRDAGHAPNAARETAALAAAREAGGPAPKAGGTVDVEGRVGLLIERIEGIDMLTEIGRKPWTIWRSGAALGEAGINIAGAQVSRTNRGGEALMAVTVDSPVPPELLSEIAGHIGAREARSADLNPL